MVDFTVKIGGEAGFGIMTTGLLLGKIATRSGYHAFEYAEYPSLIRGGHNVIEVRISAEKVSSQEKKADILLCLNHDTYNRHLDEVKKGGLVVINDENLSVNSEKKLANISYLAVPFSKIIQDASLNPVMLNNVALGVLVFLIGAHLEIFYQLIRENFARKNQEIVDKNLSAAKLGFEYAQKNLPAGYSQKIPQLNKVIPRMYISGNEVIGLASIAAGCKFYVAYPMTPVSNLLHYLAAKAEGCGMVVKHAEDEISVINMALGASFAGVRSMVGTSGGGFALMVESVALAGITETPLVIVMGQRPGPATSMPTWTEQGDLLFIIHSGHGEFPKIVLAPGDIEEAYQLTVAAFNLADKYQTPIIILTDKYLLEGHQSIEKLRIMNYELRIDRGKLLTQEELLQIDKFRRYQITADGISPRAIPGMKGSLHQANSYEHGQDGHTTEDAEERTKQVDKRNRKGATFLANDFNMPVLFGKPLSSLTIVSWGSMKGPILQAMKDSGGRFNYLHFSYLWPLDGKRLKKLFSGFKKFLLVENNSTAQLGKLITMVTGIEIEDKLLKYSGRPIYPEEIIGKINELI